MEIRAQPVLTGAAFSPYGGDHTLPQPDLSRVVRRQEIGEDGNEHKTPNNNERDSRDEPEIDPGSRGRNGVCRGLNVHGSRISQQLKYTVHRNFTDQYRILGFK